MRMHFDIDFSDRARDNLKGFRKRDQQVLVDAIDVQLTDEPTRPTRNRKRLEDNPLAPWELRVGNLRLLRCQRRGGRRGHRGRGAQSPQQVVHWWRGDRIMKAVAVEDTTMTAEELARMAEKEPVILTAQWRAAGCGQGRFRL